MKTRKSIGSVVAASIALLAATAGAQAGPVTGGGLHVIRSWAAPSHVPPTYGWPVKPFNRQHPVRGYLNDPRIDGSAHNFHWGVDVAAPDGTPVYAVAPGSVYFDNPQGVEVVAPGGARRFAYWHIDPVVHTGQYVGLHQLLGRIAKHWGHVHLAEHVGGVYVNPLRPGGLGPYADTTAPDVVSVAFRPAGGGRVAIVAEANDETPLVVPGPFAHLPVTAALLEWRLVRDGRAGSWQTAIDSRLRMLDNGRYHSVYAAGTTQNHEHRAGRYYVYLDHGWTPRDGRYVIQVRATDTAGNRALAELAFTVGGGTLLV